MKNWIPIFLYGQSDQAHQDFSRANLGVADRISIRHNHNDAAAKSGKPYTWSLDKAKRRFAAWINAFHVGWLAVAFLFRMMIDGSTRGASSRPQARRAGHAGDQSNHQDNVARKGGEMFGALLVWVCIGLTSVCSVIGLVLLMQVRELKGEMASLEKQFIATTDRVVELDKTVRRYANTHPEIASDHGGLGTYPTKIPIALNDSDIQIIRQYIKVAPPLPGAQPRLKLGDELSRSASLPISDAVAERLPKLQGARFAIDQNGAIVISSAGNSHVDAVIALTPASTPK